MVFRGPKPEAGEIAFVQVLQILNCHPNEIVQLLSRHAFARGLSYLFHGWRQTATYNLANYICQLSPEL